MKNILISFVAKVSTLNEKLIITEKQLSFVRYEGYNSRPLPSTFGRWLRQQLNTRDIVEDFHQYSVTHQPF